MIMIYWHLIWDSIWDLTRPLRKRYRTMKFHRKIIGTWQLWLRLGKTDWPKSTRKFRFTSYIWNDSGRTENPIETGAYQLAASCSGDNTATMVCNHDGVEETYRMFIAENGTLNIQRIKPTMGLYTVYKRV